MSKREYRLEAIHVRGLAVRKSALKEISDYFLQFNPVSFEWVTGQSANLIWALPQSSAKALLALSRPLIARSDESMEVNERVIDENGEEEKQQAKIITKEELLSRVSIDVLL
jgi:hypothetical protein